MPNAKLTKAFDYYKPGKPMASYPKGYEGDMPEAHYKLAVEQGAVEGQKAETKAEPTGGASGGTAGGGSK